jgi:hypothetical protein
MEIYNKFIRLLIVLKIIFIILALIHFLYIIKGNANSVIDITVEYWKSRIEFMFTILMSVLIMYLFYPLREKPILINHDTKLLLFLFGAVLIITARWNDFIETGNWIGQLQKSLR